jgi:hypothetical protein
MTDKGLKKPRKENTWGSIYYRWLRKGVDHGYAAWMADQWEMRKRAAESGNHRRGRPRRAK